MKDLWQPVQLGRTQLVVSRLALGSSYGVGGADLERAFERGINFFFWGLRRTRHFGAGVRTIARAHREQMVIAIQSYSRSALLMGPFVDSALRRLNTDYVDLLTLGWWNDPPPERIVDAALTLQQQGKVKELMISSHHRPTFQRLIGDPRFSAIMVRYNAAHPGAEQEVFPHLGALDSAPGVLAFTATRWGKLLSPRLVPEGERVPSATDCYRFVLSHPRASACLSGPKNGHELDQAMLALDLGTMSDDELAWMRRVGKVVRARAKTGSPVGPFDWWHSRRAGSAPAPTALPTPSGARLEQAEGGNSV